MPQHMMDPPDYILCFLVSLVSLCPAFLPFLISILNTLYIYGDGAVAVMQVR